MIDTHIPLCTHHCHCFRDVCLHLCVGLGRGVCGGGGVIEMWIVNTSVFHVGFQMELNVSPLHISVMLFISIFQALY